MSTIAFVRKHVLDVTQAEFAEIAGVQQGTVSKWENGEGSPDLSTLKLIRTAVIRAGKPWNDQWFFDLPARAG